MPDKRHAPQDDEGEAETTSEVERPVATYVAPSESRFVVAPLPSANAPVVFFDTAPYFSHYPGFGGSLTLSVQRQTSDAAGQVTEERVITAVLKAPLFSLLQLRDNINEILKQEAEHAEAVAAAKGKPAGGMVN